MTPSESQNENAVWTLPKIRSVFSKSFDVVIRTYRLEKNSASSDVVLIYASGLADSAQISLVVLPELQDMYRESGFFLQQNGDLYSKLALDEMKEPVTEQEIEDIVFQGGLVILIPLTNQMYSLDISNAPKRTPEESNVEISIKGPKDGFTEDFVTNIALIRKRIRSKSLCCENLILGRRSRTRIALMYFDDIISKSILTEVRQRLDRIDIDAIYSINQLEELLSDSRYALFPLLDFTGRRITRLQA
ncbi:Spore germination protein XA [Paenibacillus sp. P1XP2]|nr:Spore germination protein XA [Paenibacillus sp. P1XP2]